MEKLLIGYILNHLLVLKNGIDYAPQTFQSKLNVIASNDFPVLVFEEIS